jgi:hypothetical protein
MPVIGRRHAVTDRLGVGTVGAGSTVRAWWPKGQAHRFPRHPAEMIICRTLGNVQGTLISERPRTDPYERNSRIRLLPWVSHGEPHAGPRMKDLWLREELVCQFRHLRPYQSCSLATSNSTPSHTWQGIFCMVVGWFSSLNCGCSPRKRGRSRGLVPLTRASRTAPCLGRRSWTQCQRES